MNKPHVIELEWLQCVGQVNSARGLSALREPHHAAVIWRRTIPTPLQSWLDGLDPENIPFGRVILPPYAVASALGILCDASGLPDSQERTWLQTDIAFLADSFAELMGARYLRLRLEVVEDNACHKFHVDSLVARLICTYRGTGTQFGISECGRQPEEYVTVPTGSPIVLRGKLWPEQPASGLLHRSPPIKGSGETRLVLVFDPIEDPDIEPDNLYTAL